MTAIGYIDHKTGRYYAAGTGPRHAPRGNAGPNIISDTLDGTLNPVDGKRYDSKRKYYDAVRAHGCEIVGNETLKRTETPMDPVGPDVKRAIEELRSR